MKKVKTEKKVIQRFQSSTNPSVFHEVRIGSDGKVYCSCRGWRTHKHCWHLDKVKAKAQQELEVFNV